MGLVGEKLDIDFVISTGDNFYDNGLTGVDDSAFNESFSNIYTAPSLQKQWYIGNISFSNYFLIFLFYYLYKYNYDSVETHVISLPTKKKRISECLVLLIINIYNS